MKTLAINTGNYTRKATLILILFSAFLTSCSSDSNDIDEVYTAPQMEETTTAAPPGFAYTSMELEVLELVNNYRQENGLSKLSTLDIISKVAETHTNYMLSNNKASHDNFPQRSQELTKNAKAKSVGENVAYGFRSAQGALNGWLNSEGHKEILDTAKYTNFGISTKADTDGRYYFTLIFIQK